MKDKTIVRRDHKRPLRFTSQLVASVKSDFNNVHPDWSGSLGICERAAVHKTANGRYVLEFVQYTQWDGSDDKYEGYHGNKETIAKEIGHLEMKAEFKNILLEKLEIF